MNEISAFLKEAPGTRLVVQWLRFHTSTAGGMGSIPSQGAKIPYAVRPKNKIK